MEDIDNNKLYLNEKELVKYSENMRLECNGLVVYEGKIKDFNFIDIDGFSDNSIVYLFLEKNNEYYFFNRYVLHKKLLKIDKEFIKKSYIEFCKQVRWIIND